MFESSSRGGNIGPLELAKRYHSGLRVLRDQVKRHAAAATPAVVTDPEIDRLLDADKVESWEQLYEAEQRLIPYMTAEQVSAEATRRFVEAEKFAMPSAPKLKEAFDKEPSNLANRAEQFRVLLDDLHWLYTKRRLDRDVRSGAADRLNTLGIGLLVLIVIFLGAIWGLSEDGKSLALQIGAAAVLGFVGAYFSCVSTFQNQADTFDYDKLLATFKTRFLIVRLTIGTVGALVFYALLVGGLVGGTIFPDLSAADHSISTLNFAKLVFWAFLAGFSERLVSSTLDRFETQAQQAKPPG